MYLTSSLDKMMKEIKSRYPDYGEDEFITFGILIVDPRQRDTEEYIINYFPLFDKLSANYFNFYIPGFKSGYNMEHPQYNLRGVNYYFDENMFFDFYHEFLERYGIRFTFNPMLILTTMQIDNINTAEFIVIELDDNDRNSIRRAGMLFEEIFEIARETPALQDIQRELRQKSIENHLNKIVLSIFNKMWITEISKTGQELARYRIRVR